jgi:hypothetical protein
MLYAKICLQYVGKRKICMAANTPKNRNSEFEVDKVDPKVPGVKI